ncbi:hypothetical protein [Fluoribacter gormanii]|uniref:hypothetical protein n=1 Tax=Fluoribacter gormanii TaxID=464 RepID=UPI0010416C6F|nr:hypothetical protein [Fluoribacter gormanii]
MSDARKIFKGKYGEYEKGTMHVQEGGTVPKILRKVKRSENDDNEIHFIEKMEDGARGSVVKEKICLDFYGLAAKSPSSRIGLHQQDYMTDLLFKYFKAKGWEHEEIEEISREFLANMTYYGSAHNRQYVTFLGKKIHQYSDLGHEFVEYIREHERPPEVVVKDEREYPLDGLMKIAAMAKILGDPDWLGGSGGNSGFTIEDGRAEAIIVDSGLALSSEHPDKFLSKDIQFGNAIDFEIRYESLTERQKDEYIGTLNKFICCENQGALIEYIVKRNGAFNTQKDDSGHPIILLDDKATIDIISKITENLNVLAQTYSNELELYRKKYNLPETVPLTEFAIEIAAQEEQFTDTVKNDVVISEQTAEVKKCESNYSFLLKAGLAVSAGLVMSLVAGFALKKVAQEDVPNDYKSSLGIGSALALGGFGLYKAASTIKKRLSDAKNTQEEDQELNLRQDMK